MRLVAPLAVLALVTGLDLGYGRSGWSWLAGPVAAAFVYALGRAAHAPVDEPAPVD